MRRSTKPSRISLSRYALRVPGPGAAHPTISALVDRALADSRFMAWVNADPTRDSWRGVEVTAWSADRPLEGDPFAGVDVGDRSLLVTMTLVRWDEGRKSARDGSILMDGLTGEVVVVDVGPSWVVGDGVPAPRTGVLVTPPA